MGVLHPGPQYSKEVEVPRSLEVRQDEMRR